MTTIQATIAQLGIPYLENEPMSRHTTFRIGGPAALMALPRTAGEAKAAVKTARELGIDLPPELFDEINHKIPHIGKLTV